MAREAGRPIDVILAAVVGAIHIFPTYFVSQHQPGRRELDALAFVLLAAGPATLLLRRRYPVFVHTFVFGVTLTYVQLNYARGPIFVALIVSFVTAVLAGYRVFAWASLITGYLAFSWLGFLLGSEAAPTTTAQLGLGAWLLVLVALAEVLRLRQERALDAERVREGEAQRRVNEERLRIARELHDVLAHNISLINVQAGMGLHLIDEQPEQARSALTNIRDASKTALGELRSVLGVLRQVDEGSPRGPAPSLTRLSDLVKGAEAAGLTVHTEIEIDQSKLSAGTDLAVFRIVQEALTNSARYAGASTVSVRVEQGTDEITVLVEDDGRGTSASSVGTGSGLAGMRERVDALGGDLEVGPRSGGGYRVRARLPLGAAS